MEAAWRPKRPHKSHRQIPISLHSKITFYCPNRRRSIGPLPFYFPQAKDNSLSVNSQPCAGHCPGTPYLPPINCILQQLVLLLLLSRIDSSMASSENETRPGGDDCVGNGRGGRRGIRKPRREPAVAATRGEEGREGGREDHGSGRSWFSRLSGPE